MKAPERTHDDAAAMPSLCLITVPGLEVRSDWRLVHDRLLDEFPEVMDVLATTIKETILVVSEDAVPGNTDPVARCGQRNNR
jgi:hypothetical protein